jgi:hypothetical protein
MDDTTILGGQTLSLGDGLQITFHRTLRIPDDGKRYPLPPSLGAFPLRRVADYASKVPDGWAEQGGVFLPMYQREAMWLSFSGVPHALKIGIGKVCAISGERWREGLVDDPQNYVVTGNQPWIDGIAAGKGTIKQFVAMPLGMGYTVEAQVTGEEKFGGVQLQAYSAKPGRGPNVRVPRLECLDEAEYSACSLGAPGMPPPPACAPSAGPYRASACAPAPQGAKRSRAGSMGLAAGGRMEQKIYPDAFGIDTWDQSVRRRVFVHIVNSELWREITGEEPPKSPVTAKSYAAAGLPWFALYDEHAATIDPVSTLAQVKSVKQIDESKSTLPLQDDDPVHPGFVKKLWQKLAGGVRVDDGEW